jgi:hypothetical protein
MLGEGDEVDHAADGVNILGAQQTIKTLKRLATALDVAVSDLVRDV